MRRTMVAAMAAFAIGACAPATEQKESGFKPEKTTVAVNNQNWSDVVVYMVRGTHRIRLGSVTAMGKSEFRVPDAYVIGVSDVTLLADPVGSNEKYVSPTIQIFPGAQLELTVGNQLRLSHFSVYARR